MLGTSHPLLPVSSLNPLEPDAGLILTKVILTDTGRFPGRAFFALGIVALGYLAFGKKSCSLCSGTAPSSPSLDSRCPGFY